MFGIKGLKDIDRFFGDFFGNKIRVNISDNDKDYLVDAELPGVKKERISVEYKNDTLNIIVSDDNEANTIRSIYLANINDKKATAHYQEGLLTITLPKKEIIDHSVFIPIE